MTRSEFIQDIFIQTAPMFINELLEYDDIAGEKPKELKDVYLQAFELAAKAAEDAATIIQTTAIDGDFWK